MSKSVVDETEVELKQISQWPWRADPIHAKDAYGIYSQTGFKLAVTSDDFNGEASPGVSLSNLDTEAKASLKNLFFLAKSPERLAALCKFVRAAVDWIDRPNFWGKTEHFKTSSEYRADRDRRWSALQSARKELGLGKE